ncbi:MAG: hypothetical protein HC847_23435 [Hydrococcus sp. RU_2_2]|jgi:hypothetical protein|nr:hypothetical protein [Hydrococcus sp. RU_2_2]NJP20547.1 hypothetical protein [Hydrococcus sp. CRU_1_1]
MMLQRNWAIAIDERLKQLYLTSQRKLAQIQSTLLSITQDIFQMFIKHEIFTIKTVKLFA